MTEIECDLCDESVESIGRHYINEHGLNGSVFYQ